MKTENMKIMSHTFIGGSEKDGYTYEITFNRSLQHTCRMGAMCEGLDRYDRRSNFWFIIHSVIASPLYLTGWVWTKRFFMWTNTKF